MAKQTATAAMAALMVWAVCLMALGIVDDPRPGPQRVYTPNGVTTIHQDLSGAYSRTMRGSHEAAMGLDS